MSNVSNSAKSLARTKMREAKERGEDLKYTAALSEVADTSHTPSNSTPLTDILPRIRAAMRVIEEGMRDNPCYLDKTREQVRITVSHIISSSGDKPKTYSVAISGYRNTGKHHIADVINKALIAAGTVADMEVQEYDPKMEDFSCVTEEAVAGEESVYFHRHLDILNNIRESAFKGGSSMTGVRITIFHGHVSDSKRYKSIPSRISTWMPPTPTLIDVINERANKKGFTITENAVKEFEYILGRCMNDGEFFHKWSWSVAIDKLLNRAVATRINSICESNSDDNIDTDIYAEDLNEAARHILQFGNYPPLPDRVPVPTQMEAHKLSGENEWDLGRWDKFPGLLQTAIIGSYWNEYRYFTTSCPIHFRPNGNGNVFGDRKVVTQFIDDTVVSLCERNHPKSVRFAALVPKGETCVWGNLPHVDIVTDDVSMMFGYLRKESQSRKENPSDTRLYVLFLREDIESLQNWISEEDRIYSICASEKRPNSDAPSCWSVAVKGADGAYLQHIANGLKDYPYYMGMPCDGDAVLIRNNEAILFTMFPPEDDFKEKIVNRIIECWNESTE